MPRTRNVTRAQWDAAHALNSTTTRDQNYGCESEKENEGRPVTRATRSQTRVLGSTTTANLPSAMSKGVENTVSTNATKVKGKTKDKAPPPKRKKFPLQDITSQFLSAPAVANRGEENEGAEHVILQQTENGVSLVSSLPLAQNLGGNTLGPTMSMSHPAPIYSPLPPSSPPSAITSSPQYPKISFNPNPSWLGLSSENNLWNQFDEGRPASHGSVISSNSDPFGFVALERKLKVERTAAAPSLKRHHHQDESDELGEVLVADTSSPRLVRRLKRPLYQGDSTLLPPAISEHAHYAAPPTPHKDKKKRRRLSREEDRMSSSSSSSIPSTPSPSKPAVQKRAQEAGKEDTLGNDLNGNQGVENIFGETINCTVKIEPSPTTKPTTTPLELGASLDGVAEGAGERANPTRASKKIKIPKKPRSTRTKKTKEKNVEKNDNKWKRERQERAAYFKRLEGYQVEKEDVYVI